MNSAFFLPPAGCRVWEMLSPVWYWGSEQGCPVPWGI